MPPAFPLAALDAEGAILAAAGAQLGRALILTAGVAIVVAMGYLTAAAARGRAGGGATWAWRSAMPHAAVGAAVVIIAGGLIGSVAAGRNSAILEGGNLLAASLSTAVGAWSLAAVVLGAAIVAVVVIGRRRPPPAAAWSALLVGTIVVAGGSALAADLPRPERQSQATIDLGDGVQGTVVLTPGASGRNDVRVSLNGPPEQVAPIRAAARDGGARVDLRELASGARTEPLDLVLSDQGDLRGEGLVAGGPGRWRVTLALPGRSDPVITDVTLQANPRHRG